MFGRRAGDGDPPGVRGLVRVARRAGGEQVADAAGDDPELAVGQGCRLDQAGERLHQVDVDQLAAPAVEVAVVQRHHHREGGGLGRDAVGQEEGWERRGAVRLAGDVGEAAHGLGQGAEPRAVAGGAAPAVAADMEHHEAGMGLVHRLEVEAPLGQGAGAVVHDDHVADVEQPVEQLLAVGAPEVERDTALVAAHALPEEADAVLELAPGAQGVADARLLHLDDVGAELAQRRGHHRARGQRGGVDHPEALEGPARLSHCGRRGAREPQMLAQRRPGVVGPEHAAPLQLGHDEADDVLVGTR